MNILKRLSSFINCTSMIRKNKIYSVSWAQPVAAAANWVSFFQIENAGREMDLKGIHLSIGYYDNVALTFATPENSLTQRFQFNIVPAAPASNIMVVTGGIPFFNEGVLTFDQNVNIKFDSFFFTDIIPMTVQGWNNAAANGFTHFINLIIEVKEL